MTSLSQFSTWADEWSSLKITLQSFVLSAPDKLLAFISPEGEGIIPYLFGTECLKSNINQSFKILSETHPL